MVNFFGQVDSSSPNLQLKIGPTETVCTQQAINSQPNALSLVQAREADVEALSQLTRALDKKVYISCYALIYWQIILSPSLFFTSSSYRNLCSACCMLHTFSTWAFFVPCYFYSCNKMLLLSYLTSILGDFFLRHWGFSIVILIVVLYGFCSMSIVFIWGWHRILFKPFC